MKYTYKSNPSLAIVASWTLLIAPPIRQYSRYLESHVGHTRATVQQFPHLCLVKCLPSHPIRSPCHCCREVHEDCKVLPNQSIYRPAHAYHHEANDNRGSEVYTCCYALCCLYQQLCCLALACTPLRGNSDFISVALDAMLTLSGVDIDTMTVAHAGHMQTSEHLTHSTLSSPRCGPRSHLPAIPPPSLHSCLQHDPSVPSQRHLVQRPPSS